MMSSLPSQSFRCFRSSWFFWRVLFWSCYCSLQSRTLRHFGLVFIFALANLFMAPVGILSSTVLAPPTISKSYAFRMGPLTVIFPIFGFGIATGQQKLTEDTGNKRKLGKEPSFFLAFSEKGRAYLSLERWWLMIVYPERRFGKEWANNWGSNRKFLCTMQVFDWRTMNINCDMCICKYTYIYI